MADTLTSDGHRVLTIPPEEESAPHGAWLHSPRRRRVSVRRALPSFLFRFLSRLLRFVCALRLAIRSLRGHISVLLAKKEWTVILGGSRLGPKGFAVPDARTIERNRCIQELSSRYPWASMVEQLLFLEGFDRGEQFALHTGKREQETCEPH